MSDHRITIAEAAQQMQLPYNEVSRMVFAQQLEGGRDRHGLWVDQRAVKLWLENHA